jgi:hypothetical protein
MPKVLCSCDNVINCSEIPCEDEYLLISEVEYDKLPHPLDSGELVKLATLVVRCPSCQRLIVFWDGLTLSVLFMVARTECDWHSSLMSTSRRSQT